jgi:photosystem II stability/assembly factor-like uncharacterized protein
MNKFILTFIFLTFASAKLFAQNGWLLQESSTTVNLRSITSIDGVNVMAVGEKGTILLSIDKGLHWGAQLQSPTQKDLNGVAAISSTHYCIVGPKDTIYYTTDRGVSWHGVRSNARGECGTHLSIYELTAIDYDSTIHRLCAVGNQGEAVFSSDSGKHWLENSALPDPLGKNPTATNLTTVSLYNGLSFTGGKRTVIPEVVTALFTNSYTLSDQIEEWDEHRTGIWDIFGCDLKGWTIVGTMTETLGGILHSTNNGMEWDWLRYDSIPPLRSVHFGNEVYGYLCGDRGFIMNSINGGSSWQQQHSPVTQNLRSVHFSDPFHGFICGDSGVILTTQDGGIFAGVKKTIINSSLKIYPNPTSGQTTISIEIPDNQFTKLRIYDVLGNVVADIAGGNVESGSHSYEWNAGALASGMYIVKLESGGKIITEHLFIEK